MDTPISSRTVHSLARKMTAVESVVSTLEDRIYSGQLKDGQMLPAERELIDEFEISRTVARESIRILEGKGLIDVRPRHRPIVRTPDVDSVLGALNGLVQHLTKREGGVRQIFDMRIFVEAGLVRSAATEAQKSHISRLKKALEKNGKSIHDSVEFYETDTEFHAALYSIPGNPVFPALHRSFCKWLKWHWQQMPRLPERNARNYESHKRILEAVLDRDPDQAEMALRTHLDDAWVQVQNTFKNI